MDFLKRHFFPFTVAHLVIVDTFVSGTIPTTFGNLESLGKQNTTCWIRGTLSPQTPSLIYAAL
jgi:hypothetical protein